MRESDFETFAGMLDAVLGLYPRPTPVTPQQRAMFFRAVSGYSLAQVRDALDGHVKDAARGRFAPLPADVVAQIEGAAAADGRPGAEEAWAIAAAAADEAATVVWTAETAQAWAIAWPVMHSGDKVGARMAFREAYDRLVAAARAAHQAPAWTASLGHDAQQRNAAIADAVQRGQVAADAYPALAAPSGNVPLLESGLLAKAPPAVREGLERIKTGVTAAPAEPHGPLAWAWRLKAREEGGEKLSPAQRADWRQVLTGRVADEAAPMPSTFTPPPADALPPGMRPKPSRLDRASFDLAA